MIDRENTPVARGTQDEPPPIQDSPEPPPAFELVLRDATGKVIARSGLFVGFDLATPGTPPEPSFWRFPR